MAALVLLALIGWRGADGIRRLRTELGRRVEAIVTDQVPTAADPRWTDAPIPRRGLLLRDDLRVAEKPDGAPSRTLGMRRIVSLLNVWPLRGEPTHYLIGQDQDRPIGWVKADDLLRWDTRLVVRPPQQGLAVEGGLVPSGSPPLAVTAIDGPAGILTLAEWDPDGPWRVIRGFRKARLAEIPAESLEVLATRKELLVMQKVQDPAPLRDRAVLGRLVLDASTPAPTEARQWLEPILRRAGPIRPSALATLTRINEDWRPDASWNGLEFRGIPLVLVP